MRSRSSYLSTLAARSVTTPLALGLILSRTDCPDRSAALLSPQRRSTIYRHNKVVVAVAVVFQPFMTFSHRRPRMNARTHLATKM